MAVANFPLAAWTRALRGLCANPPKGQEVWAPASTLVAQTFPAPDIGPPELQAFADRQALWSRRLAIAYLVIIRYAEDFIEAGLLTRSALWFRPEEGLCRALHEVYGTAESTNSVLNDRPLSADFLALIIAKAQAGSKE